MNYKSIHFPVSVNHVTQERSDSCGVVKQTRRSETPIANRDKYRVKNQWRAYCIS